MGDFRIVVEAVGGHGCERSKGHGDLVAGCGSSVCPDCIARELVESLKTSGATVKVARLEHWPADLGYDPTTTVVDDLLTGVRSGRFPG